MFQENKGNKLDSLKSNRWASIGKANIFVSSGSGTISGGTYQGNEYNPTFDFSIGFNIRVLEKGRFALLTGLEFDFLSFSTTLQTYGQSYTGSYYSTGSFQTTLNQFFTGIPITCAFRLTNLKSPFYLGIKAGGIFGVNVNTETNYNNNLVTPYAGAALSLPFFIYNFSLEPFYKRFYSDATFGMVGIKLGYAIR